MRPRLPFRRILFLRPFRPPNKPRLFTQNTLLSNSRPQLPFLSPPNRRPIARFITTETKQWIKSEFWLAGKWTAVLWVGTFLFAVIRFGVEQEVLERKFPSPHEWSWLSRKYWRNTKGREDVEDNPNKIVSWVRVGEVYLLLIGRLEDPDIDGAGLQDAVEGGILVDGVGKTGYDISSKPEPWRRGYYEAMMGAGRSAEHLDGWVKDRTRNISFPGNVVIGRSNPDPRPVPPWAKSPPKEEDCDPAFPTPDSLYMKILTTQGFTEKQRVDAALAYASWLEYKGTPNAAFSMYQWALDIATSSSNSVGSIDKTTGVLTPGVRNPSANVLSVATAIAVHHAANNNLSQALPIFISILRARRSLPDLPQTMHSTLIPDDEKEGWLQVVTNFVLYAITPPEYPPPPDDGTTVPQRGPKERCEEAGVMTNIGEILYASKQSGTSREEGLAWTREAVDIAEEELRRNSVPKDAKSTCRQCLKVGLANWMVMVTKMSKEEQEKKAANTGSWLGFGSDQKDAIGRWESEAQVITERVRRSAEILGLPAGVVP